MATKMPSRNVRYTMSRTSVSAPSRRMIRRLMAIPPCLVGGYLERDHLAAESSRPDRAVDDPCRQPDAAGDLRRPAQAEPQVQAHEEAGQRQHAFISAPVVAPHPVADERRQVDAHERDERAEVQQLGAELIAERQAAGEREHADEQHVVPRNAVSRVDGAEEPRGQRVAPSHAIEQPRRAEMRARARSEVRDEQRQADEHEEPGAAGLARHVHERRVHVGKAGPVPQTSCAR